MFLISNKNLRGIIISFWGILVCCFTACSSIPERYLRYRNGVAYGKTEGNFRHRWWNYYERGLSYAEGEFYMEAVVDLHKALTYRDKDQRAARTYGHHLIDYFPNRELGIIYYLSGKYSDAQ